MVGTGALAPFLIAAHRAVRPIRETLHLGARSGKGRRPGRAPCRFRDPSRRRTRSRRSRRCRRHHHLRHAVARAAGAGRVAQTRRASRSGRLLSPGHARDRRRRDPPRPRLCRYRGGAARGRRHRPAAALRRARARGHRRRPVRAGARDLRRDGKPPTRSRCSNRSAPRSKTSPPPGWFSAVSESDERRR